ncbi:hypothetical protein F5B21DRAFT_470387 [Xylaria acuta]|nr:hypothetical protein F5B21DRAFT_470387 [Xylaria acuta]
MSSNTAGTTFNPERVMRCDGGLEFDKPTWVAAYYEVGLYDTMPISFFQTQLANIITEKEDESRLFHYKWALQDLESKTSSAQNEVLNSVLQKTSGMVAAARGLLGAIEVVSGDAGATETIRGSCIYLLERYSLQEAHLEWIEYWAKEEPENVEGLLMDAREFPDPPFV